MKPERGGVRARWGALLRRDTRPAVQFFRYAVCGGIATGVDILLFYALAWRVLPALSAEDPLVRMLGIAAVPVEEALRARNYVMVRGIGFVFANFVTYLLNALLVFEGGRHGRRTECLLFYAVSVVSLGLGTALGWSLIRFAGWSTTVSYAGNLVASILINFAGRKTIVFQK